jgi:hypothetical protein
MRWKRLLVLAVGLLACLGLVALVVWRLWPAKPGVTPENFHLLRVGMTEQEVEATLGGPGELCVAFDGDGKAVGVYLFEVDLPSTSPSFLNWLRSLLGLCGQPGFLGVAWPGGAVTTWAR